MKKIITCLVVYMAVANIGFAQASAETTAAMKKLYFLEGVWKGKGWTIVNGVKEFFDETETSQIRLSGACVQIEAAGLSVEDAQKHIVSALATISYDEGSKKYSMRLIDADGSSIDPYLLFTASNTLEWGLSSIVKFTIKVEQGIWEETGYKSKDGTSWEKTFEMRLSRQ